MGKIFLFFDSKIAEQRIRICRLLIPDLTPNEFGFNIVRKTYTNISDDSVHFIVWRKKYFIIKVIEKTET